MDFTGLDALLPPLASTLARDKSCHFQPLPFSAAALLALAMPRAWKKPVVLITETSALMDEMRPNLETFSAGQNPPLFNYPPLENIARDGRNESDAGQEGERLRTLAGVNMQTQGGPALFDRLKALSKAEGQSATADRTAALLPEPFLINTCVQALMQRIAPPAKLAAQARALAVQGEDDPDQLAAWLATAGYDFFPEVQERGQAARRGGLLDVWPPAEQYPLRIEFEDRKIETIRNFDVLDQRSFAKKEKVILWPASEAADLQIKKSSDSLAAYLPKNTIFFWIEKILPEAGLAGRQFAGFDYHADLFEKAAAGAGPGGQPIACHELIEKISGHGGWQCFSVLLSSLSTPAPRIDLGFEAVTETVASQEARQRLLAMLATKARHGRQTHFFFATQGALDRFQSAYGQSPFKFHLGKISEGFLHDGLKLGVIAETNFYPPKPLRSQRQPAGALSGPEQGTYGSITDATNIEPGDLVVHANHGIGKYLGLYEIVVNGKLQETFAIEYANRARLYAPIAQANLISRYFTAGSRKTKINRLGGKQWERARQAAQRAIYDLAAALLETQALRETLSGFAYPPDSDWQHDFEAAFPYAETEDQTKAIREVKADMQSATPMDRLICGDAGYGKTEVALRAAFKAVLAGKQVGVLVPTTVLALQHYEVFQQRLANYPVRVELLCRLRAGADQARLARELRAGGVDIVIGTHRLLQPDVGFKDLGLIIIDEEQRFGVRHKEHLKRLKKLVDVLTLTATPIPRTLYLSLTGARKISMIQTPPKDRLSVATIIAKNDDQLVRAAVLRELNRGGQVFYIHNRIATINKINARLKTIVPEAKIAVAHGQMAPGELAATMRAFARGLFDILLCTTIVESGVDLPNVNTILIDRADRFGIADLYQLRGRVGRSDRKAYAYLLTPIHGYLLDVSRRRLGAVIEHSQLGAGFKLAMLDLEIRGAGNLLGAEQSGHIAAIGFDLYCQSLQRAIIFLKSRGQPLAKQLGRDASSSLRSQEANSGGVGPRHPDFGRLGEPSPPFLEIPIRRTKSEGIQIQPTTAVEVNLDFIDLSSSGKNPASAACLPAAYVEDEELRVKVYRKIAAAAGPAEIAVLGAEFRDRFGPRPKPFERLLKIAVIRLLAAGKKITAVESKAGKIMLRRAGDYLQVKGKFPRLRAGDADGRLEEIIHCLKRIN